MNYIRRADASGVWYPNRIVNDQREVEHLLQDCFVKIWQNSTNNLRRGCGFNIARINHRFYPLGISVEKTNRWKISYIRSAQFPWTKVSAWLSWSKNYPNPATTRGMYVVATTQQESGTVTTRARLALRPFSKILASRSGNR